jgi:hypothetical protein
MVKSMTALQFSGDLFGVLLMALKDFKASL